MMSRVILFLFLGLVVLQSCHGEKHKHKTEKQDSGSQEIVKDSTEKFAEKFIWYSEFSDPQGYVVEEPDIHNTYEENPEKVAIYFPLILEKYELPYYGQVLICCYLYLVGEKEYLEKMTSQELSSEEKYIVEFYTKNFGIPLE